MILKIIITGYSILICAIFANIIANYLQIQTWYIFLNEIIKTDLKNSIKLLDSVSVIWLLIIYPSILSFGYLTGEYIYKVTLS